MLKFLVIFTLFSAPVFADEVDFSADDGLVWNQSEKKITMHKNATAKTDGYTLVADMIEGLYRDNKKIYLINASGSVRADSVDEHITADKMKYELEAEVITLTPVSNPVYMKTSTANIYSKRPVIYYKLKGYATAGDAEIIHAARHLFADNMKIIFASNGDISKILANGHIRLVDGAEELYGDSAEYNPATGVSTIYDNVYFKKGTSANLSGGKIIYDMNTGIANVLPKVGEKVSGSFNTDKGLK